jgi:predicted deacylase
MRTVPLAEFSIADFPAGRRERLLLAALPGLIGPVSLPALVARGAEGRTLIAIAGVHGDEYEGMEAIRVLFDKLDPAKMRGTFIGLPIANPFAYEARARVAPLAVDGLNLARVFPGESGASASRALAKAILDFVAATLTIDDLLIDFHSGSADVAFAPVNGFRDIPGPARVRSEEAARQFGLPNLWCIPDSPGPLNAESSRLGIPTIGTETTGRAGCDPEDVAGYLAGLRNILDFLGILPGGQRARDSRPARNTINVVAPTTGFLRASKRLHDDVTVGEELGTIVTPFGDPVATIRSPVSGTVWASRAMPPVRVGELMFMIALVEGESSGRRE